MNIKRFSLAATVFAALMLSACETTTTSSGGGNWTNIGTISEGNIKVAIDRSSIKRNGALVTFRDKKNRFQTERGRFVNTPAYKNSHRQLGNSLLKQNLSSGSAATDGRTRPGNFQPKLYADQHPPNECHERHDY